MIFEYRVDGSVTEVTGQRKINMEEMLTKGLNPGPGKEITYGYTVMYDPQTFAPVYYICSEKYKKGGYSMIDGVYDKIMRIVKMKEYIEKL